jgi:hypothetical protein
MNMIWAARIGSRTTTKVRACPAEQSPMRLSKAVGNDATFAPARFKSAVHFTSGRFNAESRRAVIGNSRRSWSSRHAAEVHDCAVIPNGMRWEAGFR